MNLITNSTFQVNSTGALFTPAVKYGSGTLTVVSASLGLGLPANYITIVQATDKCGVYFDIPVQPNRQYVFSFYAKGLIGFVGWYVISDINGTALTTITSGFKTLGKQLQRFEIPFTTLATTNTVRIDLYEAITTGYSANITAVQLEECTIANKYEINVSGVSERLAKGTVDLTGGIIQLVASHDYSAAAVDWTLSTTERKAQIISVTNANGAVNAIFNIDTPNFYLIDNQSGQALTCKNSTGGSIVVASTKRAIVYNNGTAIVRITADA